MYTKHFFLFTDKLLKLPNLLKPYTSNWSLNVKPVSRGQDEWFLVLFYIYTFFISYTMMTRYMVYDNHKEELTLISCHEIFKFSWKKLAYYILVKVRLHYPLLYLWHTMYKVIIIINWYIFAYKNYIVIQ
jgi:hypothetical protein